MLRTICAALLSAMISVAPVAAAPADEAQEFIRSGVDRALAILEETAPADPARTSRFRSFVDDVIDTNAVALFTLGHYRKGAEPALVRAFVQSFRAYATASYESRLGLYGGQTIMVGEATARTERDMLVKGTIKNKAGEAVANVAFRVLDTPRGLRLFDAQVEGIWLAVEQRSQFGSFLAQHNGDLQALIDHLSSETARMHSTSPAVAVNG
jgi:phospholipid transport system substrate-binding protein